MADFITGNETSHDPPKDENNFTGDDVVNSFKTLSAEATSNNEDLAKNVIGKTKFFQYPDKTSFPKHGEGKSAKFACRYRKWARKNYRCCSL